MPELRTVEELRTRCIEPIDTTNNDASGIYIDNDDESTSSASTEQGPLQLGSPEVRNPPTAKHTTQQTKQSPSDPDAEVLNRLSEFFLGDEEESAAESTQRNSNPSPTNVCEFPNLHNIINDHTKLQLQRTDPLPSNAGRKSALKSSSKRLSERRLHDSRSVSFSNLCIREYSITLGDNPSCSYGVPISLGWDFNEHKESLSLDMYESTKKKERRNRRDLILSYNTRRHLLKRAGYTKGELKEALHEVNRIKYERDMTKLFLITSGLEDVVEQAVDSVKSMFLPIE